MQIKKRNVKRKNVQTGKEASVIAYNNYLYENLMCTWIEKKEAIFSNT